MPGLREEIHAPTVDIKRGSVLQAGLLRPEVLGQKPIWQGMGISRMTIPAAETMLKMVREIQEVERQVCTEWEITFVQTIRARLENDLKIFYGQSRKLEEIYKKVCASPY